VKHNINVSCKTIKFDLVSQPDNCS